MDENQLSAKDSLRLIQTVIDQSKQKYEENGVFILVWGVLVFFAGVMQYAMIANGNAAKSYLPWVFTMIPGFAITLIAKAIEGRKKSQAKKSRDIMGYVWLMAGCMAMFSGFVISYNFSGKLLTTIIWAPFCVAAFSTALFLRERFFILMSIIAAALSYAAFYVPGKFHPLLTATIALVLMILPGIKLFRDYKNRNRV